MRKKPTKPNRRVPRGGRSTPPPSSPPQAAIDDTVDKIDIASLTLDTPLIPLRRPPPEPKPKAFLFLHLPTEIRLKIYEYYFDEEDEALDLSPDNYKRLHKRLGIVRVCRRVHDEATHVFYSTRAFRIFPTFPGRYFKSKKPLLARLKPIQRECITELELRLGPGWDAPPRGWVVNDALGLKQCISVRVLRVMVQCDPSEGYFKGFRRSIGFYEEFSRHLLDGVLAEMPASVVVEFDGWPGVRKCGPLLQSLITLVQEKGNVIRWGPERGWTDETDDSEGVVQARPSFLDAMAMAEYGTSRLTAAA